MATTKEKELEELKTAKEQTKNSKDKVMLKVQKLQNEINIRRGELIEIEQEQKRILEIEALADRGRKQKEIRDKLDRANEDLEYYCTHQPFTNNLTLLSKANKYFEILKNAHLDSYDLATNEGINNHAKYIRDLLPRVSQILDLVGTENERVLLRVVNERIEPIEKTLKKMEKQLKKLGA